MDSATDVILDYLQDAEITDRIFKITPDVLIHVKDAYRFLKFLAGVSFLPLDVSLAAQTIKSACDTYLNAKDLIKEQAEKHLFKACEEGNLSKVKILVDALGIDVDTRDAGNNTPLHYAAREGHLDAIKFLTFQGANLHVKNKQGQTAADVAYDNWCIRAYYFLDCQEVDWLRFTRGALGIIGLGFYMYQEVF